MQVLRKSAERGHFDHGWLNTYHSFSFGEYHDEQHMGYRSLRVINEDYVAPGRGFAPHSHRDMEIISYIAAGALEHKDSLGNGSVIRPGDVQHMSAGSGVQHSEFNPSHSEATKLIQVWIRTAQPGAEPYYGQTHFPRESRLNQLRLVASGEGREGSLPIRQDADMYAAILLPGSELVSGLRSGRGAWLQLLRGQLSVNGTAMSAGDGLALEDEAEIRISAVGDDEAELLLFDLA
jgi:redox-sensitive bicupin YhaK (pirin superfamily)